MSDNFMKQSEASEWPPRTFQIFQAYFKKK
jgi:hypothetical protein